MFTMILTLTLQYKGDTAAIAVVPGFASQAACLEAGNAWINQQIKAQKRAWATATALCSRTGE